MQRQPQVLTNTLDLTRERCPMAFVRCKHALLKLQPGESLQVHFKDPSSVADILDWCRVRSLQASVFNTNNETRVVFLLTSDHASSAST
ncbi:sulfurtransferase TusA family protein [Neiella marina]|uniref:sulfurtransferase TusA family protein n=1 Tax=Neiella marina TaxID=508461 RepID=UPI000B3D1EAD